jgi:hypothetical protein
MDNLPLEGWIWEIIRRSEKYINSFDDFSKSESCDNLDNVLSSGVGIQIMTTTGNSESKFLLFKPINDSLKVAIKHEDIDNAKILTNMLYGNTNLFFAIPRPAIKYIDFSDNLTPKIQGIDSLYNKVRCLTYDELKTPFKTSDGECLDFDLQDVLSPFKAEDTLYIGIHRNANREEILQSLSVAIKKYLQPSRVKKRNDRWKYYLIVHDMKNKYPNASYDDIAEVLSEAYPIVKIKRGKKIRVVKGYEFFDTKNCENFYKSALTLINGDYKKYLYL